MLSKLVIPVMLMGSSPPGMGTAAGPTAPEVDGRQSAGLAIIPSGVAECGLLFVSRSSSTDI